LSKDKIKEIIGAYKIYLGFIFVIFMGLITHLIKSYDKENFDLQFFTGFGLLIGSILAFARVAKRMHTYINSL
jgi:hypothetical protein